MKKNLLLTFALLVLSVLCFAQTIITTDSIVKIDSTGAKYPMVQKNNPADLSAAPDKSKRTTIWLETGDGFFTTSPSLEYGILGTPKYDPLLLATNIYDTSKDKLIKPTKLISTKKSSFVATEASSLADLFNFYLNRPVGYNLHDDAKQDNVEISENAKVKIYANAYDIVPGDPMSFALVYKTPIVKGFEKMTPTDSMFKLYFFYNDNTTFTSLSEKNNTFKVSGVSNPFSATRFFNNEVTSYNEGLTNKLLCKDYKNGVCFTIKDKLEDAKTLFVSLSPFNDLEFGKSGSVYAVLTNSRDSVISTDEIANMPFAPAHDPNYIVQRPNCLKFPKKAYPFSYTVHFQNTGAGNAVGVKTIIHLPKGLDWSTFKIDKATFAGVDYTSIIKDNVKINKLDNTIEVNFSSTATGKTVMLKGTNDHDTTNLILPGETMGEFLFTIQSTANTDDSLIAYADIYFKSQHPSTYALTTGNGYEEVVTTNKDITRYKECCTCNDPGCFIILGLCWWWWLLILLGVLVIWYLLAKRRKKKEPNTQPNTSQY